MLLNDGANINATDVESNFGLKYAVIGGNLDLTRFLLEEKANVNQQDKEERTVLHYAVNSADPNADTSSDMENLLLDFKADVNIQDIRGRTPLHYAFVKIRKHMDNDFIDPIETVTNLCSSTKIKIDIADKWNKTPLHYCSQRGSTISALFLLSRKAELEQKDKHGNTPLAIAFLNAHPNYAIMLIEKGAIVTEFVHPEPEEEEKKDKGKKKKKRDQFQDEEEEEEEEDENEDEDEEEDEEEDDEDEAINYNQGLFNRKVPKKAARFRGFGYQQPKQPSRKKKGGRKTVTEEPFSMFRVAIREGWQGLVYLLIEKKYDYMLGMQDALTEEKFKLVLNLLKKTPDDRIVQKTNSKNQNLLHLISMHGGGAEYEDLINIYSQFKKKGVKHHLRDTLGRTALHYAAESSNAHMLSLLLKEKYDPNLLDNENENAVILLIKGDKISTCQRYLQSLRAANASFRVDFKETYYLSQRLALAETKPSKKAILIKKHKYTTTPLLHAIRYCTLHPSEHLTQTIRIFLQNNCSPSETDSDGKDAFMYCAITNDLSLIQILLKYGRNVKYDKQCLKLKKSLVHYAVEPYSFGSYQNHGMLRVLLKAGFEPLLKDANGRTPLSYAAYQCSGVLMKVFKEFGIEEEEKEEEQVKGEEYIREEDWEMEIDYEKDANEYMQLMQDGKKKDMKEKKVKCDPSGNFNEGHEVVYDDELGPYDLYMTKVRIMISFFLILY
jgi:ankyrin repeat protein